MIQSRIIGTGHYLPEKILTNKDLEKFMDTTDEWIRQRTGISQRHVVEKGQGSSDVAAPAALMAIKNAGVDPKDIDLIVCGTTSPDHIFPTTGCVVQAKIGASNAAAYDVNAACSGFVYALATADAFIKTGRYKNVLTIGVDVASSYLNYERRETAVL
ncbi:MAG: 3-oxoacyl-ACP synthase, partial [Candidatus Hydrogenedentes bacterium]|nr:3-oxoacyl-ACP synthase [Candidatus Hydrogenedentota bacterium]